MHADRRQLRARPPVCVLVFVAHQLARACLRRYSFQQQHAVSHPGVYAGRSASTRPMNSGSSKRARQEPTPADPPRQTHGSTPEGCPSRKTCPSARIRCSAAATAVCSSPAWHPHEHSSSTAATPSSSPARHFLAMAARALPLRGRRSPRPRHFFTCFQTTNPPTDLPVPASNDRWQPPRSPATASGRHRGGSHPGRRRCRGQAVQWWMTAWCFVWAAARAASRSL